MKRANQFDEVMIVNPSHGRTNSDQRVRLMRFHNTFPPEFGGYAEPEPYGYYAGPQTYGYYGEVDPALSYYGQVDPTYGYYGEVDPALSYYGQVDPTFGYYGEVDPALSYYGQVDPTYRYYGEVDPALSYYGQVEPAYGYYGQVDPAMGHYGQAEPNYGYYAQAPEVANVGGWDGYGYSEYQPGSEPVGYFAEEQPMGYYGEEPAQPISYYGQAPEMVGYGEPEIAEEYPGVAYYGEPDYAGYVRETEAAHNPGCPLPTNVNGFEDDGYGGYSRPATVNPSCDQITPQPGFAPSPPDTFKPLW